MRCSISTDDPAMLDTDLTRDYDAARSLGVDPRSAFEAGTEGALCDEGTRERLRAIGRDFDWAQLTRAELVQERNGQGLGARRKPRPTPGPPARGKRALAAPRHEFSAAEADMFFRGSGARAEAQMFVFLASGTDRLRRLRHRRHRGSAYQRPLPERRQRDRRPVRGRCQGQDRRRQPRRVQGASRTPTEPRTSPRRRRRRRAVRGGATEGLRLHADVSDYEGQATRLREAAEIVQEDSTAKTGGTTFGLQQNTLLGRALGQGKIDQELTAAANQTLTEQYYIQKAYTRDPAVPERGCS